MMHLIKIISYILGGVGIFAVLQYSFFTGNNLTLKKSAVAVADICKGGQCEPQIRPDCKNSNLRIRPCQQISAHLWTWINTYGVSAIRQAYFASGFTDEVKQATLFCNSGIYQPKKTYKRWSQHSFRRACDGNKIKVNGTTFTYKGHRLENPRSRDDRFFVAFLDTWGTFGPGLNVRTGTLSIDFNRGVRDCREDKRHCRHYHISKPCYACIFTSHMAYE